MATAAAGAAAGLAAIVAALRCRAAHVTASDADDARGHTAAGAVGAGAAAPPASDLSPADAALLEFSMAYCQSAGLLMGVKGAANPFAVAPIPFNLRPTALPRDVFASALALAKPFNQLYDAVARDVAWLRATLRKTVASDAFTSRLMHILQTVLAEGVRQPLALGIHRSDYMLHAAAPGAAPDLRQVEFNTIASSFGCLSTRVAGLHATTTARFGGGGGGALPANDAQTMVADGLVAAHRAYGVDAAVVLCVVQPGERNVMDQRMLELSALARGGVATERRSLAQVKASGRLGAEGQLLVRTAAGSEVEVAVVYFRAGYTPTDYPSEAEWGARLLIERSAAIKCPSVAYHLAGTKKVQQALAEPGAVERFVSAHDASLIRRCFAGLWALDGSDPELQANVIAKALRHPEAYVLKPQREGGGNNLYGSELAEALKTMSPNTLAAHILMERIFPPTPTATLVLPGGVPTRCAAVSELGVYSVFLCDGRSVPLQNTAAGYLLRTKPSNVDEGGVASGYSVLDSVVLV